MIYSITINYRRRGCGKPAAFNCLRGQFAATPPFGPREAEAAAAEIVAGMYARRGPGLYYPLARAHSCAEPTIKPVPLGN